MGLDIHVYQPLKKTGKNDDPIIATGNKILLENLKEYIYEKEEKCIQKPGMVVSNNAILKHLGFDSNEFTLLFRDKHNSRLQFLGCHIQVVRINDHEDVKLEKYFGIKKLDKFSTEVTEPYEYIQKKLCLDTKELGYQRKGANGKFYEDGKWGAYVFTENELMEFWAKYFSDTDEASKNFKENILSKFVEGKTFVSFN